MVIRKIVVLLCAAGLVHAAETVTKMSAPFTLPSSAVMPFTSMKTPQLFRCRKTGLSGTELVTMEWAIPEKSGSGWLTVYSLSGVKVKTFRVTSPKGMVRWNPHASGVTSGVYCVTLSYGTFRGSVKLLY